MLILYLIKMVLGRTAKQYWHLMRTMVTQLVEHERIKTTKAKAKRLHSLGDYIIRHSRKASLGSLTSTKILNSILTTKKARQKAVLELAQRFKNTNSHFSKVSGTIYRRRGDNAPVVTIEYRDNTLEPYPKYPEGVEKLNVVSMWLGRETSGRRCIMRGGRCLSRS